MRTKAEVLMEHYGVADYMKVMDLQMEDHDSYLWHLPLDQWTKLKLPYEAPEHPGIPSMEEIERGMRESQYFTLLPVCKAGNCFVKIGADRIIVQEAENLLYLQEHSKVRTPKVYACFSHPRGTVDVYYLVMEFIEGYTLGEKVWVGLTENDQDIIISKIAEQLQLLRAIPSQGYYGRVNYQSFGPTMSIMRTRGTEMHGPYDTYHDFIEAMYRSAELRQADCSKSPNFHAVEIEFLSRFKAILGGSKGYKPVLTHMDPKLQNIIARPILGDGGDIKDWEVVFVDWEAFGWLPEFLQILRLEDRGSLRGENFEKFHKKLHSHFEDSYEAERDFCWNASLRTCFRLL